MDNNRKSGVKTLTSGSPLVNKPRSTLPYTYRDLRDIPINKLTEAQFRYVVKTLLEASM